MVVSFALLLAVRNGLHRELFVHLVEEMERLKRRLFLTMKKEDYRLLMKYSPDTIWTMDLSGRLTYASPSVETLTGYSLEEIRKIILEKIMTKESVRIVRDVVLRIRGGSAGEEHIETEILALEFLRKDGSRVWGETRISGILDETKRLVSILCSTRDITKRKRMENQLLRDRDELQTLLGFYRSADTRHWASNIRIIRASCSKRQFNLLVYAALCMDKIPSRESGFANIPKATAGTSLVVQCGRT
ncbi:PAS domain S-box protein [uncultured Desulfobacter sp.]|uniref:PAS domain-containing protein n=1 Tax=uncultured Desulfobacter sp. TaxID=240139 RepID=UPI002AA5ECE3|nr:PAS domain S-box protein [uncultured Desulfobacter sp.]